MVMNVVNPARISVRTVVPFSFSLKNFSIFFSFSFHTEFVQVTPSIQNLSTK